jgi:hypothetical protein
MPAVSVYGTALTAGGFIYLFDHTAWIMEPEGYGLRPDGGK